jgi:SAM-dependent methyltransferase
MLEGRYIDGTYLANNPKWGMDDSPWKAEQIHRILARNRLSPLTIAEIGCGAGRILADLQRYFPKATCDGYDISPQAHDIAQQLSGERLRFHLADMLSEPTPAYDLLLLIDVFEHVPDYLGFLSKCKDKASHKVLHIPLDMHVSAVLRDAQMDARNRLGHLHYFSATTALATLRDTGYEIIDSFYTAGNINLFKYHPTLRKALANVPRWLIAKVSEAWAAKLLGGYSLMVLAK